MRGAGSARPTDGAPNPAAGRVGPTIAALRAYAGEIRDAEVEHALARLGDLSARDAVVVRALAQRIVGKLLHRPTAVLEAHTEGANIAHVVRRLFQLEAETELPEFQPEGRMDSLAGTA